MFKTAKTLGQGRCCLNFLIVSSHKMRVSFKKEDDYGKYFMNQ